MDVNTRIAGLIAARVKSPAAAPRAVEKASTGSRLHDDRQPDAQHRRPAMPRLQVELVCQDETPGFDPFWDGPRLKPTFAAQLLGQMMPERRAMVAVEPAYGAAAPRQALLVDRKS